MKKVLNLAMYLVVASLLFVSCSDDDNDSIPNVSVDGIYVLNEGSTNGSISFINKASGEVSNDYFSMVNNLPLGAFPQSMTFSETYGFIVVTTGSGQGYVEIVDKDTFEHVKSITGLAYPREITVVEDMAYVSNGSGAAAGTKNEIIVIDLTSLEIVKTIEVGAGPEKMVLSGKKLYVANSGGWSNSDKTVSVIDTETNTVIETLEVKNCPKDMVADAKGNVWVFSAGVPDYSNYPDVSYTNSGISKITVSTSEVESFDLNGLTTPGVKNIAISRDRKTIYFMSDAVYAMDYKTTALPTEKFLNKTFYGIDVNPENGNIWCCNATFGQAGEVVVYDENAQEMKSFAVGIMPNSTNFKY
jgi:YVTN family beta-propeller protein